MLFFGCVIFLSPFVITASVSHNPNIYCVYNAEDKVIYPFVGIDWLLSMGCLYLFVRPLMLISKNNHDINGS